jgi:hypothetical protein
MDYQELYMSFTQEAHTYTLSGLQAGSPKIISSHRMEKLLKKGHHGVISQFNSIQVTNQASLIVPPSLQLILDKYPKVFEVPVDYLLPRVSMIIASLSCQEVNPPMYIPTGIHLLKKMK